MTSDDHVFARDLAVAAGELLVALRARLQAEGATASELKHEGDRQAHELLMARLADGRPGDAVLSESATQAVLGFVRDGRAQADAAEALAPLSAREQEVARLLAAGASNEQIARRLFLSENTVKSHVKAVLAKLGLPDRVHVVIWAYETGVLRPGG